jgi:hypothetical protein
MFRSPRHSILVVNLFTKRLSMEYSQYAVADGPPMLLDVQYQVWGVDVSFGSMAVEKGF